MLISTLVFFSSTVWALFVEDANRLAANADILANVVHGWNRNRGIRGALNIQRAYRPLDQAVIQLRISARTYGVTETDAQAVQDLAASISDLLFALTSKATDLRKIGAFGTVSRSVQNIVGSTEIIMHDIYANAKDDPDHLSYLSYPFWQIDNAFSTVALAYGIYGPSIPKF